MRRPVDRFSFAEASSRDANPVLELLLDLGRDANEPDDAGWSALHHAASVGFVENAKTLLAHGADVCRPTSTGMTPAEVAEINGHVSTVALLRRE